MVSGQWSDDSEKLHKLLKNPKQMGIMSEEAKEWSQQYTLERFEEAIKEVLLSANQEKTAAYDMLSPAPFRARPDSSGDGTKRGKDQSSM